MLTMWLLQKIVVLGKTIEALKFLEFCTSVIVEERVKRLGLHNSTRIKVFMYSGHRTLRLWISNQTVHQSVLSVYFV